MGYRWRGLPSPPENQAGLGSPSHGEFYGRVAGPLGFFGGADPDLALPDLAPPDLDDPPRLAGPVRPADVGRRLPLPFSACPETSNRNRLGSLGRGLPHFMRVSAKLSVSRSWARVMPT